ncbi:hypothetical protein THAOC_22626, partial [Thalassiosira oceanica]
NALTTNAAIEIEGVRLLWPVAPADAGTVGVATATWIWTGSAHGSMESRRKLDGGAVAMALPLVSCLLPRAAGGMSMSASPGWHGAATPQETIFTNLSVKPSIGPGSTQQLGRAYTLMNKKIAETALFR